MNNYPYIPKRAFIEPGALEYPLGQELFKLLSDLKVPITKTASHNRIIGIPGKTPTEKYYEGKNTLVIGVRRGDTFQSCKPSAHYQLPLATSCPGKCEYCYLNTTLGPKPYLRVYVNLDEILQRASDYVTERLPETTIFEGAATSDPLATEPFTGSLAKTIEFFALEENARFRFVTKFANVDSLLSLDHRGHTRFRFSLNSNHVINSFEHSTPRLNERINAAQKVALAGYPLGFIIGPIMYYDGYEKEYTELFEHLSDVLDPKIHPSLAFEFITHRFTKRAKNQILGVFPQTSLPMDEQSRQYKYGQFGYGKYIYTKEEMKELKSFFENLMAKYFPLSEFAYFV